MKRTIAVLTLSLLTLAAAPLRAGDVQNEIFRLTLPEGYGEFAKQVQTVKSPEGEIESTNWVSKAPTGEAVIVTMNKLPGKILDADKLFASTRESLLKSLNATLESEEKLEGALPSTRVNFSGNGVFFRTRFVAQDDHFYQLLYVGRSAEQRSNAAVGQIFDSFNLQQ
ncbi:MAG TPA: hypothetical protein VF618_00245 [Thermoanaerobaculia bacterium]